MSWIICVSIVIVALGIIAFGAQILYWARTSEGRRDEELNG